jgi:pSer/pThr/pTyr-binding forkhead associated (FHA) protein
MDQERVTIGRDRANYIVLDSRTISRRHAEILQEGQQFFVLDLKSDNGTLLNERPLPPEEKNLLHSGDLIQIDDYDLHFQIPAASTQDLYEITDTDLLEIKMVKKLLKAIDRDNAPSFEILEGPQGGTRFALAEKNQDVVIGRDPACEFSINSEVISRKHAKVEKRFDTVVLHDLESKNGTFVNRERVREKRLQDGDIVHLGTLALSFRNPQELAFDLEPPRTGPEAAPSAPEPAEELPAAAPEGPSSPPPIPGAPQPRASRRRGAKKVEVEQISSEEIVPEEAPPELPPEEPAEDFEEAGLKVSKAEIAAIAVGLIVLIGSIWGILKLLK